MSLLNKKFTGRIEDGKYTGAIVKVTEGVTNTNPAKEYVTLTIRVNDADFDFILFENPFEWAIRDLANNYFKGCEFEAGEILEQMMGVKIPVVIYTDEYAGRKFQRLSFNPDFGNKPVLEAEPEGNEPEELEFN